ncbi:hypothetical protein BD779DRAFT_1609638 [Infundibulicybe gibba]|nr:hypothetical protein BD779DRAFT_1609638 [Infundibulicybe gibba]
MALPMLVGGADCGPSNPLQGLSKRFDQDRGLQQDHFGPARAGSSRDAFRTQHAGPSTPDQDAARFFSSSSSPTPQMVSAGPYDVSALRGALPLPQAPLPVQSPLAQQQNPLNSWASDFMQQQPAQPSQAHSVMAGVEVHREAMSPQQNMPVMQQGGPCPHACSSPFPWSPGALGYGMGHISPMHAFGPHLPMTLHQQQPIGPLNHLSWDKEFTTLESNLVSTKSSRLRRSSHDGDELARTAGILLETVKNEQNPKFQNSQFLGLMKQLRDRMVVVEGNQMGKGRELNLPATRFVNTSFPEGTTNSFAEDAARHLAHVYDTTHETKVQDSSQQDANDAYFQQENAEYARYWNEVAKPQAAGIPAESTSWDRLQKDWDHFEATAIGIHPINNYQFQDNNPYFLGDSSKTRHHTLHNSRESFLESVLELEAAVQRDINNASAWFELGVKQQENEREHKALQALQRAVELDPAHLPTWLALAISHTNDNNRTGTYNAIQEWVDRNDKYQSAVQQFRAQLKSDTSNEGITERYSRLIQCLMVMARSDTSGEVDADIQIALAVLLNTNEDYDKAQDCFRTALAVRPDDWLLYNRVGATMANSGHAEDALQYYYRALELNPVYIRARFNLGISCINLRRYEEAAQHILDALMLQDSDGVHDPAGLNESRGVTSTALWDSLKTTCLHMQRMDLATLCDRHDLEGFRINFHM